MDARRQIDAIREMMADFVNGTESLYMLILPLESQLASQPPRIRELEGNVEAERRKRKIAEKQMTPDKPTTEPR